MKLRATVKIRNEAMIRAREARGWSQAVAAEAAGVPAGTLMDFEALRYDGLKYGDDLLDRAAKIAITLGLSLETVLPGELVGRRIESARTEVAEVSPAHLLAAAGVPVALPGPADQAEANEVAELVRAAVGTLSFHEQRIVAMRHGLGGGPRMTLEESACVVGVTRERVRGIEAKALRKLAHPSRGLERLI